jgi:hypothetical protein
MKMRQVKQICAFQGREDDGNVLLGFGDVQTRR